jgi:hypothetical protein
MKGDRIRGLVICGWKVTDAQRQDVARFLGRDGLATNDEMRAFLEQHGQLGLDAVKAPLFARGAPPRVPLRT